jgi:hypothetical protein
MEGDMVKKTGSDRVVESVRLEATEGPYVGDFWNLETGGGLLFGRKPTLDDSVPGTTCVLAEMRDDTEMEPTHAYFEYVPGRGVQVIDKSGGLTYITYTVPPDTGLRQFCEFGWVQLGQSVKIGRTVLKIERFRPLED